MKKVWFITGSSRGLGRKITEVALGNGDLVAATALGKDDLNDVAEKYKDQVLLIELNVTDKNQIENAIEETVKHFGRIDVLVNNAGFGITGAAEAYTDGEVKSQLEVNLYGAIEITRLVIPIMRKQGDGRILQISSVGGRFGNPGLSIYHAAKFGLTGFSEAVGKEVAPLGIKVTSVEPGSMRTDWGGASMGFAKHVDGYGDTVDKMISLRKEGNYIPSGDPVKAAQAIYDLARHPEPPVHLILGSDAAGIIETVSKSREEEFKKWMPVSLSIDHDDTISKEKTSGHPVKEFKA